VRSVAPPMIVPNHDSTRVAPALLRTSSYRSVPPRDWERISTSMGASHFHAPEWLSYRASSMNATPLFFVGYDGGGVAVGVAAGYLIQSPRMAVAPFTRRLILESHPLVAESARAHAPLFFDQIVSEARRLGCVTFELQSFFSGGSPALDGDTPSLVRSDRVEFVVDLRQPIDAVWKTISKEQREKIRRAEKAGLAVHTSDASSAYQQLLALQVATRDRRTAQGHGYALDTDGQRYDDLSTTLAAAGLSRLFLATYDGQAVSAILFGTYNKRAYSIYSGSDPTGYKFSAPSLIFWRALQWFQEQGFEFVNRGGVSLEAKTPGHAQHGIYFYNSRLGTTEQACTGGVMEVRPWLASVGRLMHRVHGQHRDR
jgi:CelD/BcsL family acetyltransferase involved in cellulose biosynthesis